MSNLSTSAINFRMKILEKNFPWLYIQTYMDIATDKTTDIATDIVRDVTTDVAIATEH